MCDTVTCIRCNDVMGAGETYYDFDGMTFCEDCFEAFVAKLRHTVGEVIDKI